MAYIEKPKRKSTYVRHDKAKDIYTKVYNTSKWRKLRDAHLMYHPICERCGKELAEEVHHIVPISTGESELDYIELGFNPANLMALCSKCHHEIHKEMP